MNANTCVTTALIVFVFVFFGHPVAFGQSRDRIDTAKARLESIREFAERLPASKQRLLSASAQNMFHVAKEFPETERTLRELLKTDDLKAQMVLPQTGEPDLAGADRANGHERVRVSRPTDDLIFSQIAGFTQSETSTSWCGNNAVVGFNDSGSLFESLVFGTGGLSFNGYARSGNRGASFVDQRYLNPGPNFFDFLGGDPVVGCSSVNVFYYASLFETGTPLAPLSAISVSKSVNGGLTFGDPIVAASKSAFTHFLDKEWLAVDPTDPSRLFVTYTDFDISLTSCGSDAAGEPIPRVAIELSRSTDGGATWSAPIVIDEVCSPMTVPGSFVQGSQVAVGPEGDVYVAWERYAADYVTRDLRLRRSIDHGLTFSLSTVATDVTCVGDCFALQGGFRDFIDLNALVVDRSGTASGGMVYLAWQDGRNVRIGDLASPSGFYSYADILVLSSTDHGATWSPPMKVNTNTEPLRSGKGTDQYQAALAVDKNGGLAACFYDRRRDAPNWFIDRFCARSDDRGETWHDVAVADTTFTPFHATDALINPAYMGDYDTLISDFTLTHDGFVGAFQIINARGNPNVFAVRLVP
jgi:hypothetical protein